MSDSPVFFSCEVCGMRVPGEPFDERWTYDPDGVWLCPEHAEEPGDDLPADWPSA